MRLFESEEELKKELQSFIAAHKTRLGLVSLEAPLISNLAIWSNIALIRQSRLSVIPISKDEFEEILRLGA